MTAFHAAERPRLGNGRPAWLGCQTALPGLYLTPASEGEGLWDIEMILEDHWVGLILTGMEVNNLLVEWRQDPEAALQKWFKVKPPPWAASPQVQESAGTASKTAEELDL